MQSTANRDTIPDLPTLTTGVTLVDVEGQAVGPVQTLVLDHLLLNETTARWIDVFDHVQTQSLARLAPSERILDRIQVARAFTPFQHAALVEDLVDEIAADAAAPLVVAPALDGLYRDPDGTLATQHARALLNRAVARLDEIARRYDIPVVLTRTQADEFSAPIATAADEILEIIDTRYGPRFSGDDFETLVYPVGDGLVQTTLAFWERVVEQRQPIHAVDVDDREPAVGVAYGTH